MSNRIFHSYFIYNCRYVVEKGDIQYKPANCEQIGRMLTAQQQCSVGINVNGVFIANIDVGDTEVWGQVLTQCSLC